MAGTVVQVLAEPGETVRAGRPVVILESMKMEHEVAAASTGTVRQVTVSPGDTVAAGDQLVVIEEGGHTWPGRTPSMSASMPSMINVAIDVLHPFPGGIVE